MRTMLGIIVVALVAGACSKKSDDRRARRKTTTTTPSPAPTPVVDSTPDAALPPVEEGPGLAVAIAVDRSGSMGFPLEGSVERKEQIARRAIERALEVVKGYAADHTDFPVKVGLFAFGTDAEVVEPIGVYDATFDSNLDRIPFAYGETAIGDAMALAQRHLKRAGVFRKHIVVITDGENTHGADPAAVTRALQEEGTQVHFVAFDTDPAKFGFLKELGGTLLSAHSDKELVAALREVYERKILVEAPEPP